MQKSFLFALIISFVFSITLAAQEPEYRTMKHRGCMREYYVYVPDSLNEARPLLILTHGHGGKAKGYAPFFVQAAKEYGFAICIPQALNEPGGKQKTGWNVGYPMQEGWKVDDCSFILSLANRVQNEFKLNPKNLFFSGVSNGGEMCYYLAHRYPQRFAAIASLAGLCMEWIYREYTPSCAVPFIEVHGTADLTSRWEGDPENKYGWGKYISVPAAVGRMISTNCCTREICDTLPLKTQGRNVVVKHHYTGGTEGKDVILYEILGGRHSNGNSDIDLPFELWSFFKKYLK